MPGPNVASNGPPFNWSDFLGGVVNAADTTAKSAADIARDINAARDSLETVKRHNFSPVTAPPATGTTPPASTMLVIGIAAVVLIGVILWSRKHARS